MRREPIINTAAAAAAVAAIIRFAVHMGWVHFDETQIASIMTVVAIVLPLLVAVIARQWVSPVGQKIAAAITAVETVAAKPETRTLITEGETVINDVLAHVPPEGQAVAVAVTPASTAPAVPDGAPVAS